MYSIPVYALRFAAHCRSRLRFAELSADETARSSAVSGVSRIWIRSAPHPARAGLAGRCELGRTTPVRP